VEHEQNSKKSLSLSCASKTTLPRVFVLYLPLLCEADFLHTLCLSVLRAIRGTHIQITASFVVMFFYESILMDII
jgi:hypothetical protein